MTTWQIGLAAVLVCCVALMLFIAAISRHKKAGAGELNLMGASAVVDKTLEPEGSVLVRGELWRARSRTGDTIERGQAVRVVGVSQFLLEVEPARTDVFKS